MCPSIAVIVFLDRQLLFWLACGKSECVSNLELNKNRDEEEEEEEEL